MNFKQENVKFLIYLVVPVVSVILFSSPQVYENVIRNRRYIVYELGREAEDEDIDVASLTPEAVNATEVDPNVLKSLDAVIASGQANRVHRVKELAEAQQQLSKEQEPADR